MLESSTNSHYVQHSRKSCLYLVFYMAKMMKNHTGSRLCVPTRGALPQETSGFALPLHNQQQPYT